MADWSNYRHEDDDVEEDAGEESAGLVFIFILYICLSHLL